MLTIRTINTTGLSLFSIIEKVDIYGNVLSPRIVWNETNEEFEESVPVADSLVAMTESVTTPGFYSVSISDIDGNSENLFIIIVEDATERNAIGGGLSTPGAVAPDVLINFEVEEDRA